MENRESEKLRAVARSIRRNIVEQVGVGRAGHLGGSCSIADVVAVLYFHTMKLHADDPKWEGRDRLIFSKGHTALCQYAALCELGVIDRSLLSTVKTIGGKLQGHPDMRKCPGIEANTGSLGQGLSISLGMALGLKLDGSDSRVYCILGDGELDEGQVWEAAMAAASYKADNLTAIVDRNTLQASGTTDNIMNLGDVAQKFRSFGWQVFETNGHDVDAIAQALDEAKLVKGAPAVVIAHTVKGKGVSFAEGQTSCHNCSLTKEQYDLAMSELQ